nr:electron transfer flavoprotein subunit alpha/FixB family protein [Clostridia bacterium]
QTGLTADCTGLSIDADGLLLQTRPAFGGRWMADILCKDRRPQMASVRPDVFPTPTDPLEDIAPLERVREEAESYLTLLSRTPLAQAQALADAPAVIAGGKGIGSKKGFEKLERLAGLLGGAVGATRAAVDAGFADYSQQIGQTGRIVRPKLYIALAISGMAQHVLGMQGAQTVVAVNQDRHAPIFSYANHGIVADWEETVDAWIRAMEERERKRKE